MKLTGSGRVLTPFITFFPLSLHRFSRSMGMERGTGQIGQESAKVFRNMGRGSVFDTFTISSDWSWVAGRGLKIKAEESGRLDTYHTYTRTLHPQIHNDTSPSPPPTNLTANLTRDLSIVHCPSTNWLPSTSTRKKICPLVPPVYNNVTCSPTTRLVNATSLDVPLPWYWLSSLDYPPPLPPPLTFHMPLPHCPVMPSLLSRPFSFQLDNCWGVKFINKSIFTSKFSPMYSILSLALEGYALLSVPIFFSFFFFCWLPPPSLSWRSLGGKLDICFRSVSPQNVLSYKKKKKRLAMSWPLALFQ